MMGLVVVEVEAGVEAFKVAITFSNRILRESNNKCTMSSESLFLFSFIFN